MDVAQPTNAGVGQYELRGLQGAETSAPQQEQRKTARACSQTSLCTRRAQFVLLVVLTIGSAEVVWASKACTHLAKGSHIKGALQLSSPRELLELRTKGA